jgi:hypothetical protein
VGDRTTSRSNGEKLRSTLAPRVTGTVVIDLREAEDDRLLRHYIYDLAGVPDGARAVIVVGDRWIVDYSVADDIRREAERLDVDVQGTARAVARWVRVIRTGERAGDLL